MIKFNIDIFTTSLSSGNVPNDVVFNTPHFLIKPVSNVRPSVRPQKVSGHMKFSGTHRKCIEYLTALVPLIAKKLNSE